MADRGGRLAALGACVVLGCGTLSLGLLLASCGEYHVPDSSGGTGGASAMPGSGGQAALGGMGAVGGSAGGAGSGGGAGLGTGGAAQAGTGGSASGSGGGSGSGSAGMSAGGAGGSVEASCDNVEPCGGDVVGTWTVGGACLKVSGEVNLSGFGLGCMSSPVSGTLEVAGTFTAKDDGTYQDDTTTTGEEELELPPACLTVSGTTTTCDRVGGPLSSLGYASVHCVDNADTGGCTCTATVEQSGGIAQVSATASPSGTYTVADNALSISDGLHDTPYPYCVEGTTLTLSGPSMSKTGTSTGTVVLLKQ